MTVLECVHDVLKGQVLSPLGGMVTWGTESSFLKLFSVLSPLGGMVTKLFCQLSVGVEEVPSPPCGMVTRPARHQSDCFLQFRAHRVGW